MVNKTSNLPFAFFAAALLLASPFASQQAWGYSLQETSTGVWGDFYGNGTFGTGTTSSSVAIDSQNYAEANLGFGRVGVGVSLDNKNSTAINAYARSTWSDTWSATAVDGVIGISRFKADGVLSKDLMTAFNGWFDITYTYSFGNQNINLNISNDGSWVSSVHLVTDGTDYDISDHLVWGTNSAGDTTYSLIYHPSSLPQSISCPFGVCELDETMEVEMNLAQQPDSYPSGVLLAADFLHTFSVDLESSNGTWTSGLGRTIAPTAPGNDVSEPGTLALLSLSAAILGFVRRRSQPV